MSRQLFSAVLVVIAVLAFAVERVDAVDFMRFDVNSDGELSISDPYALLSMLFRGVDPPNCADAWDFNADSAVGIADSVMALKHLFLGERGPSDAAADLERGCEEYGTGSPLDDPQASLVILSAESTGGEDGQATLVLGASHSTPIAGHSFDLHLPGEVFAGSERGGIDITGTSDPFNAGFDGGRTIGDTFTHGFLASIVGDVAIPASDDVIPIYELVVCLREGTVAGEYPIHLAAGEFVDAASGRAILPELVGGTLTVAADVIATGDCTDLGPRPDPGPGAPPAFGPTNSAKNVSWRIDDATAAPGDSIAVPFVIQTDGNLQGYSTAVDFDEELLAATEIEMAWKIPGGDFEYGFSAFDFNNDNNNPGNAGVDEGFLTATVVFSFVSQVSLPANEDVVALRYRFNVNPEAPDTTTQVRFLDGGQAQGQPVRNVLTSKGASVGIGLLESFVLVDGTIRIESMVFVRGDSNGDGNVDLSDAQHTLNYLFSGAQRPACFDAADSNDDGQVDIADSITTLQFLFLDNGLDTLPMPYPDEGEDPTADGLTCSANTGA